MSNSADKARALKSAARQTRPFMVITQLSLWKNIRFGSMLSVTGILIEVLNKCHKKTINMLKIIVVETYIYISTNCTVKLVDSIHV